MKSLSASRVVALLTPVLAAGAAAATPWLVKTFGLKITPTDVTALAVTGATSVTGIALKWLHGNSLWERQIVPAGAKALAQINAVAKVAEVADPGLVKQLEDAGAKAAEQAVGPAAWPEVSKVADAVVAVGESPAGFAPVAVPDPTPPAAA